VSSYEVGKNRPPTATRWKPGQSGNPRGRPKGIREVSCRRTASDPDMESIRRELGIDPELDHEIEEWARLFDEAIAALAG